MPIRAHRLSVLRGAGAALCLAVLFGPWAGCGASTEIEPIPAPVVAPDLLLTSAVPPGKGWVTVVGLPGAVEPQTGVSLTNGESGDTDWGAAGADGAFALSVPAFPDDPLVLRAEGYQPTALAAVAPSPDAPRAPGNGGPAPTASAPDDGGTTTVAGDAGCVEPSVTVIVNNPRNDATVRTEADAQGAFTVAMPAAAGDTLSAFAALDGRTSRTTPIAVPIDRDVDDDGWDASVDCDDQDATRNPGAAEICGNGIDDDCDGERDEDCGGAPCRTDSDCARGEVCVASVCSAGGDPADSDGDGIANETDNCPASPNPEQDDLDADGVGDVCDTDVDGDSFQAPADCDDLDPSRYPGARELCLDGLDNDCDGVIDEDCDAPACASDADCPDGAYCDATTRFCVSDEREDADGDGIPADQDCDDRDPNVSPMAPEVCGNAVDDDCDGLIDEGC